jgi:hypothetical protein
VTDVDLVVSEWDGAAWYEDGKIVVNVRWLNVEDEAAWYIDESFMHEYVEHVLGLGHRCAVFVEKILRRILYSEWFGFDPTALLYGRPRIPGRIVRDHASSGESVHRVYTTTSCRGPGRRSGAGSVCWR